MKVGLVLGAGGTVGMAYHAGVLRALERVGGFVPNDADLVVGTSAGSLVGAYLRAGWTTEQLWETALGTDKSSLSMTADEIAASRRAILAPAFRSPVGFARRGLGSAYVVARSIVRLPAPVAPRALRAAFPAGLFAMSEGRRRIEGEIPAAWPQRDLWLCAVDLHSGRRVVLGRGTRPVSLHEAVAASCAIPGVYAPVRVGSRVLVDGGIHSSTNVDLAASAACDLVLVAAPMAFTPSRAVPPWAQLSRRMPARALASEVGRARSLGVEVAVFRPSPSEVRLHGLNMMRRSGWDLVARAAYESTARALEGSRHRRALDLLAA